MSAQIDATYRSQRIRVHNIVAARARQMWVLAQPQDQAAFADQVVPLVKTGQAQIVHLVDAYMTVKTVDATGAGDLKGLDPGLYTVDAIRKTPAADVYVRPFGALGAALKAGADFTAGRAAGLAALDKLVATDLQLSQTYSARDWMTDEPRVAGYQRITVGGCPLCESAADRVYRSEDLMPIHEGCRCDVSPVYDDADIGSRPPAGLSFVEDGELGARIVDNAWAAAA